MDDPTYPIASSPPSDHHRHHDHHHERQYVTRFHPTQGFTDRILRALGHRLLLLYRSDPNFYVLGATGNVYVVSVSNTLACTCPDRATPCKHILFVLIKVLGVSLDDPCLRRRTLRQNQLTRILANPSSTDTLAGPTLRERFHQAFVRRRELGGAGQNPGAVIAEEGAMCPICLDEMGKPGEKLVACVTCRNALHAECWTSWKRAQRRRSVSCVICRSRWRDRVDQERYLNLGVYASEDDPMAQGLDITNGSTTICHE